MFEGFKHLHTQLRMRALQINKPQRTNMTTFNGQRNYVGLMPLDVVLPGTYISPEANHVTAKWFTFRQVI